MNSLSSATLQHRMGRFTCQQQVTCQYRTDASHVPVSHRSVLDATRVGGAERRCEILGEKRTDGVVVFEAGVGGAAEGGEVDELSVDEVAGEEVDGASFAVLPATMPLMTAAAHGEISGVTCNSMRRALCCDHH
jgi:hypothetical protein